MNSCRIDRQWSNSDQYRAFTIHACSLWVFSSISSIPVVFFHHNIHCAPIIRIKSLLTQVLPIENSFAWFAVIVGVVLFVRRTEDNVAYMEHLHFSWQTVFPLITYLVYIVTMQHIYWIYLGVPFNFWISNSNEKISI